MLELPAAVAAVIDARPDAVDPGERKVTPAAGFPFSALAWGDPTARPTVLIHGVTASARIWWRVGPALAATGRRVVAPDLPGHGRTGHWSGHHRFRDMAGTSRPGSARRAWTGPRPRSSATATVR